MDEEDLLDETILASGYSGVVADPYDAFYHSLVGQGARVGKKVGLCVWSCEIEDPDFLLLTACEEMG